MISRLDLIIASCDATGEDAVIAVRDYYADRDSRYSYAECAGFVARRRAVMQARAELEADAQQA